MILFLHLRFIQDYSDHFPIFSFIYQDPTLNYFVTHSFLGTSIWNSIPEYIKTASSVAHFKSLYLWKLVLSGFVCVCVSFKYNITLWFYTVCAIFMYMYWWLLYNVVLLCCIFLLNIVLHVFVLCFWGPYGRLTIVK